MSKALIFSPHPDDAEWAMGGTIALMIQEGWDIVIVDLTNGEPTPHGSEDIRAAETKKANEILGIQHRINLGLPNRYLQATLENRRKLAEVIRQEQPDILFGPALPDDHPDHVEANKLIKSARFEAKFHKTDMAGGPHWSPWLYHYYSIHRQDLISPSFAIDISGVWDTKLAAVKAYQSQISSPSVTIPPIDRICTLCQYFGHCIGQLYGEPFYSEGPLPLKSIDSLGLTEQRQNCAPCTVQKSTKDSF